MNLTIVEFKDTDSIHIKGHAVKYESYHSGI